MKIRTAVRAALLAAAAAFGAAVTPARAALVNVPNFSFESPAVPNVSPYASPNVDNWTKEGNPFSTGEFFNTPDVPPQVDNANGNQLGFIFAVPGVGLSQDLTATYTVGQSYALTVGIQGGGGGMPVNTPLQFRLYYRDTTITSGDNRVTIVSATYKNDNTSGAISHLTDVTTSLPTVTAGNPWAGKAIGIQMVSTDDPTVVEAGYFDLDNVRLNAVPEPSSLGGLVIGAAALGLRRVRRRRTANALG